MGLAAGRAGAFDGSVGVEDDSSRPELDEGLFVGEWLGCMMWGRIEVETVWCTGEKDVLVLIHYIINPFANQPKALLLVGRPSPAKPLCKSTNDKTNRPTR